MKFGQVRSAAADWSRFPVGTVFKIEGMPYVYEVDDYGSALVGTDTIDLYKPSMSQMRDWGVRHVDIKVLRWGSYERSYSILKDRTKASHVREMVRDIKPKVG
ncbi:MAG: 3D domain-containing protein [Verrucomicrobiota bacterium]